MVYTVFRNIFPLLLVFIRLNRKAMGVGRIFSMGGHLAIFPKFFQGGPKVVKFDFSYSN